MLGPHLERDVAALALRGAAALYQSQTRGTAPPVGPRNPGSAGCPAGSRQGDGEAGQIGDGAAVNRSAIDPTGALGR